MQPICHGYDDRVQPPRGFVLGNTAVYQRPSPALWGASAAGEGSGVQGSLPNFCTPNARVGDRFLESANNWISTRTGGDGVLGNDGKVTSSRAGAGDVWPEWADWQQRALDREIQRINVKLAEKAARYHQPCGAKTRKGKPFRNMSEAGRRRCKFRGGKSTGPKTPEGNTRIAEAQRRSWAVYRAQDTKIANLPETNSLTRL